MEKRVTPPRRVTSPTWGPPPPCKQALILGFPNRSKYFGHLMYFLPIMQCISSFGKNSPLLTFSICIYSSIYSRLQWRYWTYFCMTNTIEFLEFSARRTVAHRGKTQLNFCSETQLSFEEHNNLFQNTTIGLFSRTQQSIRDHNNLFQNTRKFPDAQQSFPQHNKISWYTNAN